MTLDVAGKGITILLIYETVKVLCDLICNNSIIIAEAKIHFDKLKLVWKIRGAKYCR